jgi:riboflavin biosynthesis pyrimidine reductase
VPSSSGRIDTLTPLVPLFDATPAPEEAFPAELAALYGGPLRLPSPCLYANFVSTIDGVVALEEGQAPSGGIISGRNEADRFVMGLLRAFADVVLVGAGTVRAEGGRALWTPEYIFPAAAQGYRALRRHLKRADAPQLAIVTARGDLDPSERALQSGALVLTSRGTEAALKARLPSASRVVALTEGTRIEPAEIMKVLQAEGFRVVLTEGGPTLFGQLVQAGLVDELFLTLSPALAGHANDRSFGLIQGLDFGRSLKHLKLQSLRRSDEFLFLRYRLDRAA